MAAASLECQQLATSSRPVTSPADFRAPSRRQNTKWNQEGRSNCSTSGNTKHAKGMRPQGGDAARTADSFSAASPRHGTHCAHMILKELSGSFARTDRGVLITSAWPNTASTGPAACTAASVSATYRWDGSHKTLRSSVKLQIHSEDDRPERTDVHHVSVAKHGVHRASCLHRRLRFRSISPVRQPQRAQELRRSVEHVDERRRSSERRQRMRHPAQRHLQVCAQMLSLSAASIWHHTHMTQHQCSGERSRRHAL